MPMPTLSPVLRPDTLYMGDNGAMFCGKCAGTTALYTGRDLSGQPVVTVTADDARDFLDAVGEPPRCEGCQRVYSLVRAGLAPMEG